jgi:Glycosyl hydrolase family 47
MMKSPGWFVFTTLILFSCAGDPKEKKQNRTPDAPSLADDVRNETLRTWKAYEQYAWPHDDLLPISKKYHDWYAQSISISPIDAYSTLKLMGRDEEAARIEHFVIDSLSFDKDIFVKVFEVNIRILGGLLNMYETDGDKEVLKKAQEFGDRLLPAFHSPTGLPYYYVNLKTGAGKGRIVNVAEAGSYLLEFGILSYYTQNPKYYQTAKTATRKIHSLRSPIGLLGRDLDVETGKWTLTQSMVGAYADSYFEYLYKSWLLFKDPQIKEIWDSSITSIQKYIAEPRDKMLWYGKADMYTGKKLNATVTLWDAYFPALLVLSGDTSRARQADNAWDFLWNKEGLIPVGYDYDKDSITDPFYQLNPEVIESAYYLWHFTGDSLYYNRARKYYADLKKYCRTDIAYCHIESVVSKKQKDEMETFFIAETMKYFYLIFNGAPQVNPDDYVFSTEAHPFKKSNFDPEKVKARLAIR